MKFYVMTLFPQMILDGLNTSTQAERLNQELCV